ncbi:response regulator transcription factor [Actinophytocola sp.]|uniref:response regulator transcription factor n=1 Tax=Actinophytocola sp. TaxID=1872138 RepID=UPI0039C8751A
MARRLFITERTVKFHLSGLRRKLRARDRAHLVALSFRTGLLTVNCTEGQYGRAAESLTLFSSRDTKGRSERNPDENGEN